MHAPHAIVAALCLLVAATTGTATATPVENPISPAATAVQETAVENPDHAPVTEPRLNAPVCTRAHLLIHAAFRPDQGAAPCTFGGMRIGAGYTRLLSTTALRKPHVRLHA